MGMDHGQRNLPHPQTSLTTYELQSQIKGSSSIYSKSNHMKLSRVNGWSSMECVFQEGRHQGATLAV